MTTVLTPEEIFLPTTRWPNKVVPIAVSLSTEPAYVLGRPRFSVQNWTPDDQYAGPALLPGEIIREARERGGRGNWAQRTIKSSEVPILRPAEAEILERSGVPGPIYRDFYASGPASFWPCTKTSMSKIGMQAEINVNPTFADISENRMSEGGKAIAVAAVAGIAAFWIAKSMLSRR
ncbi:MAG TPA: hypothetical protein PKD27_02460 [Tepidiformaceae bacterium]|nr:hypothetical protein [Tepidiformaceae bacterium]